MIFGHFCAKKGLPFRGGKVSKITKIQALGSKCDPSLQDGLPGALGTDSGPILGPFWLPKSEEIGPKRGPKSIKKVIEKLDAWLNDTMHASIMIG